MQSTFYSFDDWLVMAAAEEPLRDHQEELRWIARAASGDDVGYRWLLDRYRDRAVRVAAHVLRRDGDAEDIVQEAFLQAFSLLSTLRRTERFGPWLYRIVVRLCLARMRRKGWQSEFSLESIEATVRSIDTSNVDHQIAVEALLDKLSPPMRAALVLRELEGLEYEDIASVLQIPLGTVRSRLNSARAQFRTMWQALEDENAGSI